MFKYINQLLIQQDKQKHFIICMILSLGTLPFFSLIISMILVMSIGLAKEIWDHYYGSGFCWFDMQANVLGALVGMSLYYLVYFIK